MVCSVTLSKVLSEIIRGAQDDKPGRMFHACFFSMILWRLDFEAR
jgi:hypothetical protein